MYIRHWFFVYIYIYMSLIMPFVINYAICISGKSNSMSYTNTYHLDHSLRSWGLANYDYRDFWCSIWDFQYKFYSKSRNLASNIDDPLSEWKIEDSLSSWSIDNQSNVWYIYTYNFAKNLIPVMPFCRGIGMIKFIIYYNYAICTIA